MSKQYFFKYKYNIYILFSILMFCSCANKQLTIGIVGDQFGSSDAEKSYEIMQNSVRKIDNYSPDVLIHVGDIMESIKGIESYEDYKSNFATATSIMNNTNIPWIVAVGDHGVAPPVYENLSTDRSREQWFLDCCKLFNTPIKDKLYYSKDINGYHFISLYSLENLHTDPRWGSIFLNKINSNQLSWLKEDLEKNKQANGIIVVVHHPHWYVWSNWMEVHQVLREYPVVAVIAGHFHYDQDDGIIDGIRYLVMGSTGGVIKDMDANSGGVQEYAIMKLKDSKIEELSLYEVNSDSLLEWTPRKSMDRAQAISCMLDNLWKDVSLIRKDGKIISQNSNAPTNNQIELKSLANPIDIPIEIKIEYPLTILSNPVWNKSDAILTGNEPAILKPGENVGWSNYTNVGQWYQPPGLWKADIISDDENIQHISLSVIVKFNDTRLRILNRTITYSIN